VYYGYWIAPERDAIQLMADDIQKDVTGDVRLKLYKGTCLVAGRKSDKSLYHPELATFEEEEIYNQKDAEGFIKLNALRLRVRRLLRPRAQRICCQGSGKDPERTT
jgi:argininosuccinate synthase